MSKKSAIYARVSTADQKTGLEAQVRALKEYCEQNKITSYELFSDENISGATRLYEACGFAVEGRATAYRKPLDAAGDNP